MCYLPSGEWKCNEPPARHGDYGRSAILVDSARRQACRLVRSLLAVAVQSLLCLRHTYSGRPTTAAAAAAAAAAAPGVDVNISVGGDCDAQRLLWYKRRVVSSSYTSAGLTGRERNSAYHSRALS